MSKINISKQARNNWLIDILLLLGAIISTISGIYFLFLPVNGYQGGRNPMYGVTILFQRSTWDDLHTWFGILMIVATVIHIVLHWKWIVNMTRHAFQEVTGKDRKFNARGRYNLAINIAIGLGFLLTAISGLYLFLVPGGRHGIADPSFLFTRVTWDLIHTWAGIVMITGAGLHIVIHWDWIAKVTRKIFQGLGLTSTQQMAVESVKTESSS